MNLGKVSIFISLIGISIILYTNYFIWDMYQMEIQQMREQMNMDQGIHLHAVGKSIRLTCLGLGTLGLIIGIKATVKKHPFRIVGILLSIITLILSIFPIWTLF